LAFDNAKYHKEEGQTLKVDESRVTHLKKMSKETKRRIVSTRYEGAIFQHQSVSPFSQNFGESTYIQSSDESINSSETDGNVEEKSATQ